MNDCLFCKIIERQIPADIVYEDEHCIAFKDINPKADTHWLLVPKTHIKSLNEVQPQHDTLMALLLRRLPQLAKTAQLTGFRSIINIGREGGQEIDHLHFHLLGGKNLPGFR